MRSYVMLWVILALSLLVALFLVAILWWAWSLVNSMMAEREATHKTLLEQLKNSEQLTKNLMDRLMSQDLQTYATMTNLAGSSTRSDDEYIDRSDEAEYARLNGSAGHVFPVGDTIFTEADHAENFITEIGLEDLTKLAERDG